MGADFLLETFEGSEEIEKKCSRRAVFGFDSDTELGGVVRAPIGDDRILLNKFLCTLKKRGDAFEANRDWGQA